MMFLFSFSGLALVGKDIVFRFIMEHCNLNGFQPLGNSMVYFGVRIFERRYFGLCWNLRLTIELKYLEGYYILKDCGSF
jgi:hypothetical protein